jgi:hypothetical protein
MKKTITKGISFDPEKLKKADEIIEQGKIPHIKDRSGLIDYALDLVFEELESCKSGA